MSVPPTSEGGGMNPLERMALLNVIHAIDRLTALLEDRPDAQHELEELMGEALKLLGEEL